MRLEGDVETSGKALAAPPELLSLFTAFYGWNPIPPRTPRQLAETTARLCRLLRDEVSEQLARKAPSLTSLAEDWRNLLFKSATNEEFADGYAQAVTFGLLMARARDISLADGIDDAAKTLRQSNTLIGSALRLLTEEVDEEHTLDTSLKTLTAVLGVVDWRKLSKGEPEAWLYFYELFLQQYDTRLRKRTGSYYTPPEVVTSMVRLVDEALRSPARFNLADGLASPDVSLADPAVGTGTFLLGVLQQIRRTVEAREGAGSVPAAITESLGRLIGFELQFGPFAVAQLRVLAELIDLVTLGQGEDEDSEELQKALVADLRLYITDTLADPDEEYGWIPTHMAGVAELRRQANHIKRHEPITVVIGNPPYKEKAKGLGGWVEDRGKGLPAPLDDWQPPASWGVGAHAKHLRNLYVYFWRWAAWKVFGGDPFRSGTEAAEAADWTRRKGIVAYITVAGFLNGPGFEKMRADLRRDADEIWVIDCSPEGHQPAVSTRIFQGVQQPVCIVMASRPRSADKSTPARVRFRALPEGDREEKFKALAAIGLDDGGWIEAPSDWRAPFLAAGEVEWTSYPALEDLFLYNGSGVMTGRTWVIAPDAQSLKDRWTRLVSEPDPKKKAALFHPHMNGDRTAHKVVKESSAGHPHPALPVDRELLASLGAGPLRLSVIRPAVDHSRQPPDKSRQSCTLEVAFGRSGVSDRAPRSDTHSGTIADRGIPHSRLAPLPWPWRPGVPALGRRCGGPLQRLAEAAGRALPGLWARGRARGGDGLYRRRGGASRLCAALRRAPEAARPAHSRDRGRRPVRRGGEAGARGSLAAHLRRTFRRGPPAGPPRVDQDEPTIPAEGALPASLDAMPHELEYDPVARG